MIVDVNNNNIDDFILLCIKEKQRNHLFFIKGIEVKKKWTIKVLERFGEVGKIAYVNDKPAGLIQFLPNIRERIIEIKCIFVPSKDYQRMGIGKKLLISLIQEMKKPKKYFNNNIPKALIVWAFEIPEYYPQHKFFQKMGFKKYFPTILSGYIIPSKKTMFISQK